MTDNILGDLAVAIASEAQSAARVLNFGSWMTSGPGPMATSPIIAPAPRSGGTWKDGISSLATFKGAHPGRVGGPIQPWAIVVHTTDMLPDEFAALVDAWIARAGDGACAHFLIGRDGTIVQFIPITRNGNHAGGPEHGPRQHGVFVVGGHSIHPNLVAVGIEVHCAGGVHLINGQWRLVENGVAHGAPLDPAEVTPDPARPGRGWHQMTKAQLDALRVLVTEIQGAIAPMPSGAVARSIVEAAPTWAKHGPQWPRVVGHVELDAANRSDPWPLAYSSGLMAELNGAAA